jgi:cell division septal protein FtsQ
MPEIYIHEEKTLRSKIWKILKFFLIGLVFNALIIFGLYLLIYSPIFQIQEIKLSGNERTSNQEVNSALIVNLFNNSFIKKILGKDNILIWPNNLEPNFAGFYNIKNLSIKKDFLNRKIEVSVNERKPIGLWCLNQQNKCYWFDDDGILFEKGMASEGGLILKVLDDSNRNLGLGGKILKDNFLKVFFEIINKLKAAELNIFEIQIKDLNLEEITVKTLNGPNIYFSLRFLPPEIKPIIDNFKNQNIFDKLNYIDFRVENRVYYK